MQGKKTLYLVLSWVLGAAIIFGIYFAGYYALPYKEVMPFVGLALVFVLLLWIAVNVAITIRTSKRFNAMNARQAYDYCLEVKGQIEADYKAAEKAVYSSLSKCYAAMVALFVLALAAVFLVGSGLPSWGIIVVVAACFILSNCLYLFFVPLISSGENADIGMNEQDYPKLYALCEKAARTVGCNRSFIVQVGDNTGVMENGRQVVIILNPVHTMLCTSDELYAVLLHEFAHVVNEDTGRSYRLSRGAERFLGTDNLIITLFISAFAAKFSINSSFYDIAATRHHEMLADEAVVKYGTTQAFIDATAKSCMLTLFDRLPRRELNYDCLESAEPVSDLMTRRYEVYLKYRQIEGDGWKKILSEELPARIASHPTLRQRMEALGVESYDDGKRETDEDYIAEQKKLLSFADGIVRKSIEPNYAAMRKECYLDIKALLEKYEAAEREGKPIPEDRLTEYMQAFYGIDNAKALEIADRLLAASDEYAQAHFLRGQLYYDAMDDRCVDELRAAIRENGNYFEAANELIGSFALLSGNQQLIDEFRTNIPEETMQNEDKKKSDLWDKSKPFYACKLGDDTKKEICDRIAEFSEGKIKQLYFAGYDDDRTYIVVDFGTKKLTEKHYDILNKLFAYLDSRVENFSYGLYDAVTANALSKAHIQAFYVKPKMTIKAD